VIALNVSRKKLFHRGGNGILLHADFKSERLFSAPEIFLVDGIGHLVRFKNIRLRGLWIFGKSDYDVTFGKFLRGLRVKGNEACFLLNIHLNYSLCL